MEGTTDTGAIIIAFLAAAGLGAIVGLERQVERGDGEAYAGVRTFALYALWGAASGYLGDRFGQAGFLVFALAFTLLIVSSYVLMSLRTGDWGTTTEAAAFATFIAGVLVWDRGYVAAVALAVGTAALLRAKEPLHRLSGRFSDDDIRAVLQFGVITAVVLPLVPDEDLGPFGAINLREIWLMVVLVSAIGLVGYAALRIRGDQGLFYTGLFGGLVSSTAVTLGFSQMSRRHPGLVPGLAAGVLGASGLMYPRVLVEAAIVEPRLAVRLAIPVLLPAVVVLVAAWRSWRRSVDGDRVDLDGVELKNPLTLGSALQFGALYGVIVFISKALIETTGGGSNVSLNLLGAVAGLNDVDAITLSAANLVGEGLDPSIGARMVLAAVVVNTLVKAAMAALLGHADLRRRVVPAMGGGAGLAAIAWFFV